MTQADDRNWDQASLSKKIEDLYKLIEGIEIAMFTTRRPDGHLVSRPMATQTQAEGTDLWFVTDVESDKLDELQFDPHVNLAYYRDRTREWVSVSGIATISQDRQATHELYQKDWKAWFGDQAVSATADQTILVSHSSWWTSIRSSTSRWTSLRRSCCSRSPGEW